MEEYQNSAANTVSDDMLSVMPKGPTDNCPSIECAHLSQRPAQPGLQSAHKCLLLGHEAVRSHFT